MTASYSLELASSDKDGKLLYSTYIYIHIHDNKSFIKNKSVLRYAYTIPMIIIYGLMTIGALFGLFVVNCEVRNEKRSYSDFYQYTVI
jgi:hypothetical protein